MKVNGKDTLREEIQRFRVWADTAFPQGGYGEWEMEYEHWGDLYRAAGTIVEASPSNWDSETRRWLIYAIARDNELELLTSRLSERQILDLIPDALQSDEPAAKWQLAVYLGKHPLTSENERVLLALAHDPDEYVRRRSMMALAEHQSNHTESLALTAWDSGDEYQRIASLYALNAIQSPALPTYLKLAQEDGRVHLLNQAAQIAGTCGFTNPL